MFSINISSPKHPTLAKHIAYYYFLKSPDPNFHGEFTHYPHYRTTINVYLNSEIILDGDKRIVCHNPNFNIRTVLTKNHKEFKDAKLSGKLDVIGFGFKPLGFNHFIRDDFHVVCREVAMFFDHYWPGFGAKMLPVFEADTIDEKVAIIETFLLSQFRELKERRIAKIVDLILETQGQIKVGELEQICNINRRTLLRLFKKHLGCTLSDFKRVVKFRNAISNYQSEPDKPTLTRLSHQTNYYDQSDFISHFKALTGELPKEVLKKLSRVGKKDIFWKFKS